MLVISFTDGTESKSLTLDDDIVELLKADPGQHSTTAAKETILAKLEDVVAERYAAEIAQYISEHVIVGE